MSKELIPFQIETDRVVQLLAKQIYQSPLALLRENAQNAFDAVRQRLQMDGSFAPFIDVRLTPHEIVVADNGIGMTPRDLQDHYWTAGRSSKNNEAARKAGVVGTFGIGAMANFGIATRLTVESESAISGERTICRAERSKLDLQKDCIEREQAPSTGKPGTRITADVGGGEPVNVRRAEAYIGEFVALVGIPVEVNGVLVSQKQPRDLVPTVPETWRTSDHDLQVSDRMQADVKLILSNNAELLVEVTSISWDGRPLSGVLLLRSGHPVLHTYRNGFGLAASAVSSFYQFGGTADLAILEPTAGREAITVEGVQLLQGMVSAIDGYVSQVLSTRDESDVSSSFMRWSVAHDRYDLCRRLRMTVVPGDREALATLEQQTEKNQVLVYAGSDQGVIKMHASDTTPLFVLARTNPRRACEEGFLQRLPNVEMISDRPVVTNRRGYGRMDNAESAVAYKVSSVLDSDYFVDAKVEFGTISHGIPVFVEREQDRTGVVLNEKSQSISILLDIFATEYDAFGSMTKDFVRNVLFPRIADYVPSSTREGAEAVLRAIRKRPEAFEYADDDLGSLPSIWKDYDEGQISLEQAVERSQAAVRGSVQVVEGAMRAEEVVPDVLENEQRFGEDTDATLDLDPWPGITRLEISTPHKMLVIDGEKRPLRGYRCFLALTDKARAEMGEFFLQPHRTSVVWGGQRTLFIFMHHSGEFGLYYDLQTREIVDAPAGGRGYPTCSIVLKDRIYIPIPSEISGSFVPGPGQRKRFEVRADILRTTEKSAARNGTGKGNGGRD